MHKSICTWKWAKWNERVNERERETIQNHRWAFWVKAFSMKRAWLQTHIDWKIASRFTLFMCVDCANVCMMYVFVTMCGCIAMQNIVVYCKKKKIKLQWNSIWWSTRMAKNKAVGKCWKMNKFDSRVIYVNLIKFVLKVSKVRRCSADRFKIK